MTNQLQKGFTLVEMLIVTLLSSLIFGLVFSFFWDYWQYAEKSQSDIDAFVSRLDASDYIREVAGTTSGLITQNNIADPNAGAPDPIAGSNYWLTIHPYPETITAPSSIDKPILYFKRFSQDTSRNFIFNGVSPYEDDYVIYLNRDRELRVRSLANPAAIGNALKTSCPPALATASCPADKLLINNVDSVGTKYFSRSGNLIDYTPYFDPVLGETINGPDFPSAQVLEFTLNLSRAAFTQTTSTTKSSTIVRVALRNT